MEFKINNAAVRRGNHVTTVDAIYCTQCSLDLAHPLFDGMCADGTVREDCPHIRPYEPEQQPL